MRILIDARMLVGRFAGVARFVTRLIDELVDRDGAQIVALCGDEPYPGWADRTNIEVCCTDFTRRERTPLRRWRWEALRLNHWIRQARADVFHATWNTGVPPRCDVPAVLTIHDLIPWHDPAIGFWSRLNACAYRRAVTQSARRAALITTVSEFVRRDVIDTLRVDPRSVTTVYNGAEADCGSETGDEQCQNVAPFVLYVGGFEPRKNIATLFRAMNRFWSRYGELTLRITGEASALDRESAEVLGTLDRGDLVRFVGRPSDAELAGLYRSAVALVLPSRAEGFGLPIVEAMRYGCPVVAARAGSLPEIVGDAGFLVDPDDPNGFAGAMNRLISDERLRIGLIKAGRERAASFRWSVTARRMHELYQRAAAGLAAPQAAARISYGSHVRVG